MIPDYNILEHFTVEEIDKIQYAIGRDGWIQSEERHMLLRREQMDLDIVMNLADNEWGLPIISKAAKLIKEDRGDPPE